MYQKASKYHFIVDKLLVIVAQRRLDASLRRSIFMLMVHLIILLLKIANKRLKTEHQLMDEQLLG